MASDPPWPEREGRPGDGLNPYCTDMDLPPRREVVMLGQCQTGVLRIGILTVTLR
jgi:hypothetical protein